MSQQSYQEVSVIIIKNLVELNKLGIKNLEKINLKEFKGNYQNYFFYRKNKHPKLYERLNFDTNSSEPYSKDLEDIMTGFMICGFLDYEKNIRLNEINKFLNHNNF